MNDDDEFIDSEEFLDWSAEAIGDLLEGKDARDFQGNCVVSSADFQYACENHDAGAGVEEIAAVLLDARAYIVERSYLLSREEN